MAKKKNIGANALTKGLSTAPVSEEDVAQARKAMNARHPSKYSNPFADKSGVDLAKEVWDTPQKLAVKGITSATRGGFDKGRYANPSEVMREDWGVESPTANSIADIAIDPLNAAGGAANVGAKGIGAMSKFLKYLKKTPGLLDSMSDIADNFKASKK